MEYLRETGACVLIFDFYLKAYQWLRTDYQSAESDSGLTNIEPEFLKKLARG